MTFLDENYKQPEQKSNYLKFKKDWDTKFRVMSDSITGYIYFNKDVKPVRSKEEPKEADRKANAKTNDKWDLDQVKHFRAFVVRDYASESLCILEVTQKTIQTAILAYYKNEKRGDPKDYDLVVTRDDKSDITKYTVIADPKELLTEKQAWAILDSKIDLDKLYTNEDPFSS